MKDLSYNEKLVLRMLQNAARPVTADDIMERNFADLGIDPWISTEKGLTRHPQAHSAIYAISAALDSLAKTGHIKHKEGKYTV